MGRMMKEILDYLERHSLEAVPDDVSFDDILQDNLKAKGIK